MTIPIQYHPNFIPTPDDLFRLLWIHLTWVRHDKVPRREYYSNDFDLPYTYGKGAGERTYEVQPWHPIMLDIRSQVQTLTGEVYETCFINGYDDGSDQLGWHADNSDEMDDRRSIAVVSLGAEREIWFRSNEEPKVIEKLKLGNGSLCLMNPGMQDTHQHRIPKSSLNECGPRLSLTFRGFVV